MAAEIICDGCKKRVPMVKGAEGRWVKPLEWYQRADEDGIQDACSRECVIVVSDKTKPSKYILPF